MTLMQALACGILYWLAEANVVYVTVWTIQRPLVCGWLTGLILGCPELGALCGALCSLMLITYRSTGSSMPGDPGLAGICASAAAAAVIHTAAVRIPAAEGTAAQWTDVHTMIGEALENAGSLSGAAVCGIALLISLPAFFIGIPVWRLRLQVNRSFGERTEQIIREGGRWRILFPAVLQPIAVSALICIPTGAVCSAMAFHAGRVLLYWTGTLAAGTLSAGNFAAGGFTAGTFFAGSPAPGSLDGIKMVLLPGAGLLLPLAGLLLLFFRQRERAGRAAFVCGIPAGFLCFLSGIPLFIAVAMAMPVCSLIVRNLEKQCLQKQEKEQLHREGVKQPGEEGEKGWPDPDFDPDFTEDPDADYDPDFDPDLDSVPAFASYLSVDEEKETEPGIAGGIQPSSGESPEMSLPGTSKQEMRNPLSLRALAAANLLWILFVQTAYNTRRMMGQAVALAFLPVLEEICPEDPKVQREILLRQCSYLNTQPELGSCLLGRMIAMEAGREDPAQIRGVRTALMGSFGAIGDELFQCGWIPALVLIFSDLVLHGAGNSASMIVPLYIAVAALSAGMLSAAAFSGGYRADATSLLNFLEGRGLQRIRRLMGIWLPFLTGAMFSVCAGILFVYT